MAHERPSEGGWREMELRYLATSILDNLTVFYCLTRVFALKAAGRCRIGRAAQGAPIPDFARLYAGYPSPWNWDVALLHCRETLG